MHLLGCTSVLNVDLERSWFSSLPPSRPERRVEEKLLSQCMTLSNWLGIKLLTTKTFAALKPIFKLVRASLMSALKSTTNSPWRKSRAHRGRSGCLTVCERVCVPTHKCVGESEHACGQYVCARSRSAMTNPFLRLVSARLSTFFCLCVYPLSHLWCFPGLFSHKKKLWFELIDKLQADIHSHIVL